MNGEIPMSFEVKARVSDPLGAKVGEDDVSTKVWRVWRRYKDMVKMNKTIMGDPAGTSIDAHHNTVIMPGVNTEDLVVSHVPYILDGKRSKQGNNKWIPDNSGFLGHYFVYNNGVLVAFYGMEMV